jgi:hypothetical protein
VRVVDPTEGIDETLNATVEAGVITRSSRHGVPTGRRARLRRPARPSPHARPRGRGGHRLRHEGGRGRRLLRDPRHAEHGPAVDSAACSARWSSAHGRGGDPVGFLAAISKGRRARADRDGRARPSAGAAASRTTAVRCVAGLLGGRSSTARSPAAIAVHCEERRLSRGGQCTRAGLRGARLPRLSVGGRER